MKELEKLVKVSESQNDLLKELLEIQRKSEKYIKRLETEIANYKGISIDKVPNSLGTE